MTISTTSNAVVAQGNGLTTSFSFTFPVPNNSELFVYYTDTTGAVTLLNPNTYSVTGIGSAVGGAVTYPLSGSPIATGTSLTIQRVVTYQQLTDLVNQSGYYPNVVENALDYLTMQTQQLAQQLALAITVPLSASPKNLVLPAASARANQLVGFDVNGNAVTYPITASVGAGSLTSEGPFVAGVNFTPGVTTTLTLSKAYGSPANVSVHFDGTYQGTDQYSLNGTQITFTSPIPVGVNKVYIVGGTTLSLYVPPNGTVGDAQLTWGNILNRTVDSIASLRALSSAVYTRAFVTGYYAPHDGGGGAYQFDPSDTTSSDNGGTIIVGADGGRWKLQSIGPVSLKQFGSKFDGATDDSATNQAALAWLASSGGGELCAPVGTTINNTVLTWAVNKPLKIRGAGRHSTIFKTTSTTNTAVFNFSSGTVEFADFALSGPGTSTGGVLLTCSVDHQFTNIDFLLYYWAMNLTGNVGLVDACNSGTESVSGPVSTGSIWMAVNGYAGGLVVAKCVGFVPSVTPAAGIEISNCGAVQISDSNIIRHGTNVLLNPGNGQTVASVQISNSYLDSAQNFNLQIAPATGGAVIRTFLTQAECSSAGQSGIQIDGTGGTVDGVLIMSAQANFCAANGITVTGANAKNIDIVGGELIANVGAGLSVNNGASVRATSVFSGGGYGAGGNGTGFFCDGTSNIKLLDCTSNANTSANYALPSSAIVLNCSGFSSANTGASVLPSGGTSVVVNHGLGGTPGGSQIQITPTVSTGSNPIYVDTTSITSSQFTVRCASAAAANFNFIWRATCNGQQ